MKRIDFENGTVTGNILGAALPMLAAQLLNLLYNIVDRVYIARIPHVGTAALGAVGICFPLIVIITAFCKSLRRRWCAAVFDLQRKKRREDSSQNYEYIVFHDLCQCSIADDRRIPFCVSCFDFVWSFQRCNALCIPIYDDLFDRYTTFDDCGGNESVH